MSKVCVDILLTAPPLLAFPQSSGVETGKGGRRSLAASQPHVDLERSPLSATRHDIEESGANMEFTLCFLME